MLPTLLPTVCSALCQAEFKRAVCPVPSPQPQCPGNTPHTLAQADRKLLCSQPGAPLEKSQHARKTQGLSPPHPSPTPV